MAVAADAIDNQAMTRNVMSQDTMAKGSMAKGGKMMKQSMGKKRVKHNRHDAMDQGAMRAKPLSKPQQDRSTARRTT